MRLATYLYFPNFLSKDECNKIIEEGEKDLKIAKINPKQQEELNSKNELRNTKVGFIRNGSPVQDLMEKIINHMMIVCVEAYGVYLTDVEPIQYAKYTKGMFYDWHVDSASTVDDLKIDEDINAGETKRFKFDFNKTGTFKLYCIVHTANGMVGEIIVK